MSETIDKWAKIYPRSVDGKFTKIRWIVNIAILGAYFILPWIRLNGSQALLFDIPARKFYIFNLTIWPQDFPYLAVILIFLAISLFFFTALAGRLWCGYGCPQTLFTDIFITIERLVEGDRTERINLDKSPWNFKKSLKKILKHSLWLVFSFASSFTFVSYFISTDTLIERLAAGNLTHANLFWLSFFVVLPYGFCGFLREWVCLVPCPYGRFQSALCDQNTLIIGYDTKRGEPRGHIDKKAHAPLGDCIDCSLCVQVCPTGIDIRNGLQYECIACARCIDACNSVMRKVERPEGLIRYGSLNSFAGKATQILRARLAIYAVILISILTGLTYGIATRVPLDIDVLRSRNFLYTKTPDGRIINVYTVKILNMDNIDHRYFIKTEGIHANILTGDNPVSVKKGEVYQTTLSLIVQDKIPNKKVTHFTFIVEDIDNKAMSAKRESTFLLPVSNL